MWSIGLKKMSSCVLLSIFACLLLAGVGELRVEGKTRDCKNSELVIDLLRQKGLTVSNDDIYKDFKPVAGTTCQLEETCCSHKLEDTLSEYTSTEYTNKVRKNIEDSLSPCRKGVLVEETRRYFRSFNAQIIRDLTKVYGTYFQGNEGLFDDIFEKFDLAIREGETKDIDAIYSKTFFQVYSATFIAYPGNARYVSTEAGRDCLYQTYLNTQGPRVEHWRFLFRQSFDRLMYYLRGLHAAEKLIEKLVAHSMSPQCQVSLVKMDRCSTCAGYASLRSCKGLCMNLLRGCLVDLSDLEQPLMELTQALVEANERFSSVLRSIAAFEQNVFELIGGTNAGNHLIIEGIFGCLQRSKRSVETEGEVRVKRQSRLVPRSTLEFPSVIFNETASCLRGKISSLINIPETICGASASRDNKNCWNGHLYDSYSRDVVEFRRRSQWDNPEVLYCSNPSQFHYEISVIKYVIKELASVSGKCSSDDEDCSSFSVPTNFYEFPSLSVLKSKIVSEDNEEGLDGGSGSGSGSPPLACDQSVYATYTSTVDTTTKEFIGGPKLSGATSHLWSSSFALVTVMLTSTLASSLFL